MSLSGKSSIYFGKKNCDLSYSNMALLDKTDIKNVYHTRIANPSQATCPRRRTYPQTLKEERFE